MMLGVSVLRLALIPGPKILTDVCSLAPKICAGVGPKGVSPWVVICPTKKAEVPIEVKNVCDAAPCGFAPSIITSSLLPRYASAVTTSRKDGLEAKK